MFSKPNRFGDNFEKYAPYYKNWEHHLYNKINEFVQIIPNEIEVNVTLSNNKLMLMPVSELDYYFKRVYSVDNISDINDPVKDYIKDFKEKKGGRIKFKISNSKKENIIHFLLENLIKMRKWIWNLSITIHLQTDFFRL